LGNRSAGRDAAAGNEGVGEHVRTKFQPTTNAGEIADLWIRTDEEKLLSSAEPLLARASPVENAVQPFDLMSRRHPLSSTRAAGSKSRLLKKQAVLTALVTSPASKSPAIF
jgi:hypothetical protein